MQIVGPGRGRIGDEEQIELAALRACAMAA